MVRVLSIALCAQAVQAMRMNHAAAEAPRGFVEQPCVNQNLANVAQTNIGQGQMIVKVSGERNYSNQQNMTITQSFDPSTGAIFQTIGMDQSSGGLHTEQTTVLNLAAKMLTIKMEAEGLPTKCIKAELPAFITMVPMDVLTKYSSTVWNDMLDCKANVAGADVFEAAFPPSYIAPDVAQQLPVSWVYTVTAAADGLKKSERMQETIRQKSHFETGPDSETSVDYRMKYSDGSLEGPSADQLDTSEWGKCQKVKIGVTESDLDDFFKKEGALAVGILNQYLRAAQSLQQGGLAAAIQAGEAMRRAWSR